MAAATLPAAAQVSAPGNQEPPPGCQVFTPPAAGLETAPGSPLIASFTKAAGPGETVVLCGTGFTAAGDAPPGSLSRFLAYAQTTAGDGVLAEATVQQLEDKLATVTLPASLPADSLVWLWAQNGAGNSSPVAINRTEVWWVGPDAAVSGDTVSVYGTNLAKGAGRNESHVLLRAENGTTACVATVVAGNPYKVDFKVPAGLAEGAYQVWVHNGRGGAYGWSTATDTVQLPARLQVRAARPAAGPVFNVRESPYSAQADGIADDAPAINQALADAAARALQVPGEIPIVHLPAGNYQIYGPLNAASGVRLTGAGRDASGRWLTSVKRAEPPRAAFTFSGNSNDVSRNGNHAVINGNVSIASASGDGWKTPFGALTFSGGGYLTIPHSPTLNFGNRITLVTRIKGVSSTTTSGNQVLFEKAAGGKSVFARIRAGMVEFGSNPGSGEFFVSTPFNFNTSSTAGWATLIFTYDGASWQIYQGSTLKASLADARGVPSIAAPWTIGANAGGSMGRLSGRMDLAQIHARSLSAAERLIIANAWSDNQAKPDLFNPASDLRDWEIADIEFLNRVPPFTGQSTGGVAMLALSGSNLSFRNMSLEAGPYRGLSIEHGSSSISVSGCRIAANSNYFSARQLRIQGVEFLGTGDAEQLIAVGGGVSCVDISGCSGRDFAATGIWEDSAGGRFFSADIGAGSQRYFYLGDNVTRDLAPRSGKADQNAGEQILWDQNTGNLVLRTMLSATADSVVIQDFIGAAGYGKTDAIVISGGRGMGQTRRIASTDFTTGRVTLDQAWGVIPDASSTVLSGKVVSQVAVFRNLLDGKSDYAARPTASSGVNFFNNGCDAFIDSNTITDVITGIFLHGVEQGDISLPVHHVMIANNQITNVCRAFGLDGPNARECPALLANVWRNNLATNMSKSGIEANSGLLNIFEKNRFTNLPAGITFNTIGSNRTELMLLRDNVFSRGNAPLEASTGIVMATSYSRHDAAQLSGNAFTGFATTGANLSSNTYAGPFSRQAMANNGKIHGTTGITPGSTATDVVKTFDPAHSLDAPAALLRADSAGLNSHLQGTKAICFSPSPGTVPTAPSGGNPRSCSMYLGNSVAGTVSKYDFDAAGTMSFAGNIASGLGSITDMALHNGALYVLSSDADLVTAGRQPKLFRWNGTTVSTLVDSPAFIYGTNTTVRNPGGVAVDAAGRIYIPFTDIVGTRRFSPAGAVDLEIPLKGSDVEIGPNGKVYFISNLSVVEYNPDSGQQSTIADGTTIPVVSSQTAFVSLCFGPPPPSAASAPAPVPALYLSTTGGTFLAAYGPGSGSPGTQVALRDNLSPLLQLPERIVRVSAGKSGPASAALPVVNCGLGEARYTLESDQPWLEVVAAGEQRLAAQATTSAALRIQGAELPLGTHHANLILRYQGAGIGEAQTLAASVQVVVGDFASWLDSCGLPPGTSLEADPDGDGIPLILEYGLGGRALEKDDPLIQTAVEDGQFRASFRWNAAAGDVVLRVDAGADLRSWETVLRRDAGGWTGTGDGFEKKVIGSELDGWIPVTLREEMGGGTKERFLRVRVERQ